jgi:hypothetical protein
MSHDCVADDRTLGHSLFDRLEPFFKQRYIIAPGKTEIGFYPFGEQLKVSRHGKDDYYDYGDFYPDRLVYSHE